MTSSPPEGPGVRPDVVVVGGSAGGIDSLRTFVSLLPPDLPAAVLVVLHVSPAGPSVVPEILSRVSRLPVSFAAGEETLRPGRVLVAPPDQHLLVLGDRLRLSHGPRENGQRPAVDVLFRSAAHALDQRVVAVVLSGTMDDGTAGAVTVDQRGGTVLVQDPDEAAYPGMPQSVVAHVPGARTAGAAALAAEVDRLCRTRVERREPPDAAPSSSAEVELAAMETFAPHPEVALGVPAGFGCPECSGSMFRIEDGPAFRFRCRVGHAWSAAGLLLQQSEAMEGALWMALRSLEEKAALSRQLAARALERGSVLSVDRFEQQADDAARSAELVRQLITSSGTLRQASASGVPGA